MLAGSCAWRGGGANQWPGVLAGDSVKGADQRCWLLAVFSGWGGGATSGLAGSHVFEVCVWWLVTGVRELASRCCLTAVMTELTSSIG